MGSDYLMPLNGHINWNSVAESIGRVKAFCYRCGAEFETYRGIPTVPPDPNSVMNSRQNIRVATCGSSDCERWEGRRELAVWENLPEVEAARAKFRTDHPNWGGKGKRQTTMPDIPDSPPSAPLRPWYEEDDN